MTDWLQTTKTLLAERPRALTLGMIAEQAGLTPDWLSAFSQGKMADPGITKVQRLHDFLITRKAN